MRHFLPKSSWYTLTATTTPADVTARAAMSQLVDLTGKEDWVKRMMKRTRKVGHASSETLAQLIPFATADGFASRI